MAAPLVKTRTPGIYKRGSRYTFSYRVAGKQRWESCRTLEDARRAKSARQTDIGRGEFEARSRVTLHEFLCDWISRYQGTGRRGYREETRDEDRRLLERHALRYFSPKMKLTELTPSGVAEFVGWLCDGREQVKLGHRIAVERARSAGERDPEPLAEDARRDLSDSSVRNALKPLRTALATARREGLIRSNPGVDVALPHRDEIENDEDRPRPFSSDRSSRRGRRKGDHRDDGARCLPRQPQTSADVRIGSAATGVRRSECWRWRVATSCSTATSRTSRSASECAVVAALDSSWDR